ncbi:MAG TPA: hypothetical protein VIH52_02185 [Candidatus Nanoarchaeia archaeon]|nr:hypothetical protein [uncultured archaeon]
MPWDDNPQLLADLKPGVHLLEDAFPWDITRTEYTALFCLYLGQQSTKETAEILFKPDVVKRRVIWIARLGSLRTEILRLNASGFGERVSALWDRVLKTPDRSHADPLPQDELEGWWLVLDQIEGLGSGPATPVRVITNGQIPRKLPDPHVPPLPTTLVGRRPVQQQPTMAVRKRKSPSCPKCGGRMVYEKDFRGAYWTCTICGKVREVNTGPPISRIPIEGARGYQRRRQPSHGKMRL